MDVANNWTIVIGTATIVSMILLWSKKAYLDPILKKEEIIIKKIKEDVRNKLTRFDKLIEKHGEEEFVYGVSYIIGLKADLRDLKNTFGWMVPLGIILCFISVIIVSIWGFELFWLDFLVIYLGIIPFFIIIIFFFKMKFLEKKLSRYLEGETPSFIRRDLNG